MSDFCCVEVEVPEAPDKTNRFATFFSVYGGIQDIRWVPLSAKAGKPESSRRRIVDDMRETAASGRTHKYNGSAVVIHYVRVGNNWQRQVAYPPALFKHQPNRATSTSMQSRPTRRTYRSSINVAVMTRTSGRCRTKHKPSDSSGKSRNRT